MTMTHVFFGLCALAALVGALATVLAKNPIRSALSLLLSIAGVAGLFLSLHAEFLAAIEMIVYAGAVVVLFIFVIMLIGPSAMPAQDSRGATSRFLGSVALGASGVAGAYVAIRQSAGHLTVPAAARAELGTIDAFGRELFTRGLVPFELAAALFVVAVIGAIALAQGKGLGKTSAKGKAP
jgi:NADH-quinone oxidoreductase subunit J